MVELGSVVAIVVVGGVVVVVVVVVVVGAGGMDQQIEGRVFVQDMSYHSE